MYNHYIHFIVTVLTPCFLLHRDGQIERLDEQRRQLVLSHERYVEELTADFERKLDEERQARLQLEVTKHTCYLPLPLVH